MSSAVPIIWQAGEGEQMWFAGGGTFTWKATAAETGGAFIMLEDRMERGKTTPLHTHPNEDEAIYVLEGELRESFYREAGEPVQSAADPSRPADWARLRAVAERSESIELLGPPPFAAATSKAGRS